MENTMYYTFSTIAQVIAAIIGILGAFVIFRVQQFKERLFSIAFDIHKGASAVRGSEDNLGELIPLLSTLKQEIDLESRNKLLDLITKISKLTSKNINNPNVNELERRYNKFHNLIRRNEADQYGLKVIFALGIIIIVGSLVVLSITTLLSCFFSYIFLFLFIALTLLFLIIFFVFMTKTIHKI